MLYGENVAICSELNTKHIIRCGQNVKFLNVKPVAHHITSRLEKVKYHTINVYGTEAQFHV